MQPFLQKSFLHLHECFTVNQYVDLLWKQNKLITIKLKNGEKWQLQGDPLTDSIGLVYAETVGRLLDKELSLTHTVLRRWRKGCYMHWHRNRWECEYTVAIQISDSNWPIGFAQKKQEGSNPAIMGLQEETALILTPLQGDAVIFNGAETHHGRRALKEDACTTLMLYYVEKDSFLDTKDSRKNYGDNYKTRVRPNGNVWEIDA